MRAWLGMMWALLGAGAVADPADVVPGGGSLVELFTSEGCSSCPPAESVLGELARRPDVVALAFHVDYWDGPAWRDRFAIPQAVRRQRNYVATLGLPSAFTPQVVIDGRTSLVGSNERQIVRAVAAAPARIVVKVAITGHTLDVELPDGASHGVYEVDLASYEAQTSTPVRGGENSGRTLTEFNVVRSLTRIGSWHGAALRIPVALDSLPPDADRAAVFLQPADQGAVAGAAWISLR